MGKSWPSVPLREIAVPVQRPVEVVPGRVYRTLGVKWWGHGAYERETIDGSQTAAKVVYEVREDDLIINKIWVRNGSVAIVGPEVSGCVGSNEFPTFQLNPERILPRWLHWYTKTRDLWAKCDALSQGTSGKNRIRPDRFLTIEIALPPLFEQQRIVARIEQLAEKIEEAHRIRLAITEQTTALITSIHFGLAAGRVVRVRDLLMLDEAKEPIEPNGSYLQVGIKSFGMGLFPKPAVSGSDTVYRHFNRLDEGMVVLSQVKGWEGAIAVCPNELSGRFASPEYRTFRCLDGACLPSYVAAVVATPWFRRQLEIATHGVGGRRERVRPEKFLALELPMPTVEKQGMAVDMVTRLRIASPLQSQTASELEALLPSVLDKAFRGEL